jgi:hypothetical protein
MYSVRKKRSTSAPDFRGLDQDRSKHEIADFQAIAEHAAQALRLLERFRIARRVDDADTNRALERVGNEAERSRSDLDVSRGHVCARGHTEDEQTGEDGLPQANFRSHQAGDLGQRVEY